MNVCCSIVKFFVVLMNLAFWLVGVAIVALAVWMLCDPVFMISKAQDQENYQIGLFVFLGLGILMIILACCGCCGACKESRSMLVWFFCCMLIILTAEVAAGVWAFINSDKLELFVKSNMKHTIDNEYGITESRTEVIDIIQRKLECCGVDSARDWQTSAYTKQKSGVLDLSIINQQAKTPTYNIQLPESCCNINATKDICNAARKNYTLNVSHADVKNINLVGCMEKVLNLFNQNSQYILLGGLIAISFQLFGILLILCLCCAVKRSKDDDCKD